MHTKHNPEPYPAIPPEIMNAARKVENWMKSQGRTQWKLMGIQSRDDFSIEAFLGIEELITKYGGAFHKDCLKIARTAISKITGDFGYNEKPVFNPTELQLNLVRTWLKTPAGNWPETNQAYAQADDELPHGVHPHDLQCLIAPSEFHPSRR